MKKIYITPKTNLHSLQTETDILKLSPPLDTTKNGFTDGLTDNTINPDLNVNDGNNYDTVGFVPVF